MVKNKINKKAIKKILIDDMILDKSEDIISRKGADGNYTAIHLNEDKWFFIIDGLAAEFWSSLNGKLSVKQIKTKIIAKHEPPLKKFQDDVSRFLKKMIKKRFVTVV